MKSRNCFIKIAACLLSIILVLGALPLSVFATRFYDIDENQYCYGNNRIAQALRDYLDGERDSLSSFTLEELDFIHNYGRDEMPEASECVEYDFAEDAVRTLTILQYRACLSGEDFDKLVDYKLSLARNGLINKYGDDNYFTIIFNSNGGIGNVPKTINKNGTDIMGDIDNTVPTRIGYVFMGWSANKNDTTYSKCIAYSRRETRNSKCVYSLSGWTYADYCKYTGGDSSITTLTLYAQWKKK